MIELDDSSNDPTMLEAGQRVEISYTITNQASRQDSFDLSVDYIPSIGWTIEEYNCCQISINMTDFRVTPLILRNALLNGVID